MANIVKPASLASHAAFATMVRQSANPPAPIPQATVVPVRGGLVIKAVKVTGKAYRVTAPHNVVQWQATLKVLSANNGVAPVAAVVAAGVPAPMVGYLVRRGYLAAA